MIDAMTATDDCSQLEVTWESGDTGMLSAELLRREAQDAWSRRERFDHGAVRVVPGIKITGLYAVGQYGVNVHFSDGHEKAIYPFVYLRELFERGDN